VRGGYHTFNFNEGLIYNCVESPNNCKKIPEKIFHMEKIYHIYAKNECLYHSLKEEEFQSTWDQLKGLVGLMKTDYVTDDLSYEAVYPLVERNGPAGESSY